MSYWYEGRELEATGDLEGALDQYNLAIKESPNDYKALNSRGALKHYKLDKSEEAIEDFDRALGHSPDDPLILRNRGNAKLFLEQYQAALNDFDKAIASNPKFLALKSQMGLKDIAEDPEAYIGRATVKDLLGDKAAAESDLTKAIQLFSEMEDTSVYHYVKKRNYSLDSIKKLVLNIKSKMEDLDEEKIASQEYFVLKGACSEDVENQENFKADAKIVPNNFRYFIEGLSKIKRL